MGSLGNMDTGRNLAENLKIAWFFFDDIGLFGNMAPVDKIFNIHFEI
jgi:hypothetical protein